MDDAYLMMIILMMIFLILMLMMMTKPYDYDDDSDDDNDHKNDNYTAAGAAPGPSVPCSLFIYHLENILNIVSSRIRISLEIKVQGFDQTNQLFKNSWSSWSKQDLKGPKIAL